MNIRQLLSNALAIYFEWLTVKHSLIEYISGSESIYKRIPQSFFISLSILSYPGMHFARIY